MKLAKIIGLAAMALAALMAFAGTAGATTLTSSSGTTPTITAEVEKHALLTGPFGSFGSITCSVSKVVGTVTAHGSEKAVSGPISSLTFSTCTGGTPTTPVAKPGTLSVEGLDVTGDGTVKSSGAEVIVHNTSVGKCVFVTNNTDIGRLTGSTTTKTNATLDINGSIPNNGSNPFCGSNSTWEGSYKVASPSILDVH